MKLTVALRNCLVCLPIALMTSPSWADTTLGAWTFENLSVAVNLSPAPSVGSGTASALGMTNSYTYATSPTIVTSSDNASDITNSPGTLHWRIMGVNPNPGPTVTGWNTSAPQYTQGTQFNVSTSGYTGIKVSFDWLATNLGVRNLQTQYTTNGSSWTNTGSVLTATAATFLTGLTIDLTSISAVDNNASFGVRLVSAFDQTLGTYARAADASLPINNAAGTWRFDNIAVTAVAAVPEPGTYAMMLAGLVLIVSVVRKRATA